MGKQVTKYDVYQHPTEGFSAVKNGFSWPGCFFGIFWVLVKKLWKAAILLFLALIVSKIFFGLFLVYSDSIDIAFISNLAKFVGILGDLITPVIIWIYIGFNGNKWIKSDLINHGYRLIETVESTSPHASIAIVAKKDK